jgi:hypothetical protein
MPGLVPGIHDFPSVRQDVDGRDEPGHDDAAMVAPMPAAPTLRKSCRFRDFWNRIPKLRDGTARILPCGAKVFC